MEHAIQGMRLVRSAYDGKTTLAFSTHAHLVYHLHSRGRMCARGYAIMHVIEMVHASHLGAHVLVHCMVLAVAL